MAIDLNDPALQEPGGPAPADVPPEPPKSSGGGDGGPPPETEETPDNASLRTAVAIAFPTLGCAVMVGGIFAGPSPRVYAGVAGLLGVALAVAVSRVARRPVLSYVLIAAGLFAIGLLCLLPNAGDMVHVTERIREATKASSILRPPVEFDPGWKAVVGWLMGIVGFVAAWTAIEVRWRSASLLLPIPLAAIAGISVPEGAQVASGIVVLVLFAIGLGLISSEQAGGDDENKPSVAYEVRKAVKALPLIGVITAALVALSQTGFLFPDPVFDPAQEPQKPKTQPLSDVEDRVLFEVVDTELTGPFRMGSLDVYVAGDGSWRLPPFAASELDPVPKSGIVDKDLVDRQDLHATIIIRGLGGAIVPALPNTVGIAATGPRLSFDTRNGNIRLINGQADGGFTYTVTAAGLPSVDDLKVISFTNLPKGIGEFTQIPDPPPAVQNLIDQAPTSSKWEQFDWLRSWVLDNITATGTGSPVDIPPSRVADLVAGSRKGSPFEIVATQAMLARWIGIPSRIGYGFDGGEKVGDALQVRPKNGAAFVEVYFPGFKWLPVIGTPRKAEPTVGGDPSTQQIDPNIRPSNDVAAQLYLPLLVPPKSVLAKQIGVIILLALPILAAGGMAYALWPLVKKWRRRARQRAAAVAGGPRARVAAAYAEWRDYATDLGFGYPAETPLMYVERFVDDEEHRELAWLTTRVLWGDLRAATPATAAAAEELSRSLRRRLASTQPATLRAVALVSRLSLRKPFIETMDAFGSEPTARREQERELVHA